MTEQTKDLVNMDEYLASLVKEATANEKPSGSMIGCRAGVLSYNGTPIPNNKLECIVVGSVHSNMYYDKPFDPDNPQNPICYAYSMDGKEMAPHPSATQPQADSCEDCPLNQWESDPKGGRGKACKNTRSLAVIPADTTTEEIATSEIAVLKLPVMSVKNWSMYVQKCAALHNRPPLAMYTRIGTVPDQKSQFRVTFEDIDPVPLDMVHPLVAQTERVREVLFKEYEANQEPLEKPEKKGKKF